MYVDKKMSEDSSSAALTTATDDVASTTMASSSPYDSGFYFQYVVVVIGVVGTATNALILYAMVASKEHKKHFLIFNQNALDLYCSLFLVIIFTIKLCNINYTGTVWLCIIFHRDNLLWASILGSAINLISITIERYIKVVHPNRSKKMLRKWVIWSAAAFAWIAPIVYKMALVISSSHFNFIDGVCLNYVVFESEMAALIHGLWNFGSFMVFVICVFMFCYGKILVVICRQARVMAGHSGPGSSTSQAQSSRIQTNVVKTMILVSAFYVITWIPSYIYYLLLHFIPDIPNAVYFVTTFTGFFYVSANPFIYTLKFDPVRRILVGLTPWKKSEQAGESVERPAPGNATSRTTHQRN